MNQLSIFWVSTYAVLSVLKVLQYFLVVGAASRQDTKKTDQQIQYAPSFAVLLQAAQMCLLGGDIHPNKVPRKDLKEITDQWIHAYHGQNKRPGKSFYHLNDALNDFFEEFCQESTAFYVWFDRATGTSYINQPLGLCSLVALMGAVVGMPFLLLREIIVFKRGGPLTVLCKIAASATINRVYVMSCKEHISYEQALFQYPWMSGIFSKPQRHPMIGRAVCPVHQQAFVFPKDEMKFECEVISNTSGTALVRQRYSTWYQNWWHDVLPSQPIVASLMIYSAIVSSRQDLYSLILPSALVFYGVRSMVDQQLGLHWIPMYKYMP